MNRILKTFSILSFPLSLLAIERGFTIHRSRKDPRSLFAVRRGTHDVIAHFNITANTGMTYCSGPLPQEALDACKEWAEMLTQLKPKIKA